MLKFTILEDRRLETPTWLFSFRAEVSTNVQFGLNFKDARYAFLRYFVSKSLFSIILKIKFFKKRS